MFVADCLGINEQGHLTLDGADTIELARMFGTPLYAMSETGIRQNCRRFRAALERFYQGNGKILYASKAFCCKEMCRVIEQEGLGLDVVSSGELKTALSAGFPAKNIYFHGNNKQHAEIKLALESGVGCIVADHLSEIAEIDKIASEIKARACVMLRIKPGIDAHTHAFIKTGQIDSKFGFSLENGEAMQAVETALSCKSINLYGLHCHIGSQIFETEPFQLAAEVMIRFLAQIRDKTGRELHSLNLGGGFGIRYLPEDGALPVEKFVEAVSETVHAACRQHRLDVPFILMEPGRSIVGSEGITLYTVGRIKEIPGVRKYVAVDGGMGDNPRFALYEADYTAVIANRAEQPADQTVTLAGKYCESGDLLQKDCRLQQAHSGDVLAVLSTGAYNYSMASNYNRVARPPVIFVRNGQARTVVLRESDEDLMRLDV